MSFFKFSNLLNNNSLLIPTVFSLVFFLAYATLGVVKHLYFLSGYDLAIVDQVVWRYSQFLPPITTIHSNAFTSLLADHVEFIYILLAPFYWLYNNPITLILLQAFFLSFSGIPVYLLARLKKLPVSLAVSLLVAYLSFYGVQNALWSDVHSLVFAAGILPWLIYFLYTRNRLLIYSSLVLALFSKEDIGLLTFFICLLIFFSNKSKDALVCMLISAIYVFAILFIYFPYFTADGYRYASHAGIFSDLKLSYLADSTEKQQVYLYSLGWFGFLPLLGGFFLLPAIADLFHYFIFGHALVNAAQGIFLHYRVTLAILLVWSTIIGLAWFFKLKIGKIISPRIIAVYLFICAIFFQYTLHAPLSYMFKHWFWEKPAAASSIQFVMQEIPKSASIATQINLAPHLTHRQNIFTLWPEVKRFEEPTPCGQPECRWLKWRGNPEFLLVDTADSWDIRHLLVNREEFISGVNNLEKMGYIKKVLNKDTTTLYKIIIQSP